MFGWMDALIIGKWLTPKDVEPQNDLLISPGDYDDVHLAPAIITTMIDMFLSFGSNKGTDGKESYHYVFGSA